ncbi:MAG TPA: hypothetical protein ENO05_12700, partial [Bacteroides sp.]|nr:hypothetical protein [Bacteroides sp.]
MKASAYILVVLLPVSTGITAQEGNIDHYFMLNPGEIQSAGSEYQEYDVTLKWQNLDALTGSMINCNAVKATYMTGLENDYAGWKNVSLARIDDFQQQEFKGTELPSFDGFSYRAMDTAFLSEGFYGNIPAEQRDLARWLVSDAVQMQGLADYVFDSLTYNDEFLPVLLEDNDIRFENWVKFSSRYQKLIWSGIGRHHDEICAIVKFES